jgi:hypothetical protein
LNGTYKVDILSSNLKAKNLVEYTKGVEALTEKFKKDLENYKVVYNEKF